MQDLEAFAAWTDRMVVAAATGRASAEEAPWLRRARRLGRPLRPTLERLRDEVRAARAHARRRLALVRLARFRLALAALFGVAGRAWLTAGDLLPRALVDGVALIAAAGIACGFQATVSRLLPSGWLWNGALTKDAEAWIGALSGESAGPPALAAALQRLREEEVRQGVSRRAAREAALADYAARRREADQDALARAEAAWPLAELVGIGLPVLLTLVGPLLSRYH